ncbi:MAG: hypothetical protein WCV86_05390 [Patescibacteria group bacterium]|jgi:hypothetical protein
MEATTRNEWLVTIRGGEFTGWVNVSKIDAPTKELAVDLVEDRLCASGDPDFMWWDVPMQGREEEIMDALPGWELLSVIDVDRYPNALAELVNHELRVNSPPTSW